MGGCCCCCASKSPEFNRSPAYFHYSVSEECDATISALSTDLLVDSNLDTAIPDTYRPPPAPLPYETYVEYPSTPSVHQQISGIKNGTALQRTNAELVGDNNSGSTLDLNLKNLESDEKMETHIELTASKEMEDNNSDELKKSNDPFVLPLQDEENVCPTCLEEYDVENPKIITKCDHRFHLACILEWMERSDTCPLCDQEMVFSPTMGGEL